jgi:hypothetical protein
MAFGQELKKSSKPISAMFLLLILSGSLTIGNAESKAEVNLSAGGSIRSGPVINVNINAQKIVGYNNLSLGIMLDWEWKIWLESSTLKELTEDANFKLIRLFDARYQTDGSPDPCISWNDPTESGIFDWTEVDALVQSIFNIGAEPLICLGYWDLDTKYLPNGMATNPNTELPYTDSWAAYCAKWVEHFNAIGLPVRYYEIVNEPYHYYGWDRSETVLMKNYADLYNAAAIAMKKLNPSLMISFDATTQKKALDYFLDNGLEIDYFDVHKYDGSTYTISDDELLSQAEYYRFDQSQNWYSIENARALWLNERGEILPVIFSEYNLNYAWESGTDPRIQKMLGAVWTALVIKTSITRNVNSILYYLYASSASHESNGGYGFGLVNLDNNQPWYPYYVQHMIGNSLSVGDALLEANSYSNDLRVLAWKHGERTCVLLICKTDGNRSVAFSGISESMSISWIDNTIPFTEATMQSGTIDIEEPLQMKGYTVALLQSQN